MVNTIGKLFLILNLIVSHQSFSQITYNPAVSNTYDSVFKKLDSRLINLVNQSENKIRGLVLLTSFHIDTLNKQDYKSSLLKAAKKKSFIVEAIPYVPEKVLEPDVLIGIAEAKDDSLFITISPWFKPGDEIKHTISGNFITTTYRLWNREGYALHNQNPKMLLTDASSKMVLSDKSFIPGKTIYGSAETLTVDFVQFDIADLEGKGLKLRMKYSYIFKLMIYKDDGY